jgi:hypothetical protein
VATVATVQRAERWLDEVILEGAISNADGAQSNDFGLPAGLGDVAILSAEYKVTAITTLPTLGTLAAGFAIVSQPGGQVVDLLGNAVFRQVYEGAAVIQISAFIDPDALTLWRQGEYLQVATPEMDTNATPTGDPVLRVKCVKVRPIEGAVKGPLQLVRVSDM